MENVHIKHFILAAVLLLAGLSINTANAESTDLYEQQKLTSHLLINLFLEKIDDEGISIFNNILSRDDLQSHHVSYVHNTFDDTLKVELCFTLTKQILVPDFDSFFVQRITVEVDRDGNIIELLTHVAPVE